MSTYQQFLSSLTTEFKQQAPPRFRSLWADLVELEEATDERSYLATQNQALRRIHALGCAARAAWAHPVPSLSRSLELRLRTLTRECAATHPESIEALHRAMNQFGEALYSIEGRPRVPENSNQPTEALLVESCAD